MSPLIVNGSIATDREGAIRFLAISENKFDELCSRNIIKKLGRGWYLYQDLVAAVERLVSDRDKSFDHPEIIQFNAQNARGRRKTAQGEGREFRTPRD